MCNICRIPFVYVNYKTSIIYPLFFSHILLFWCGILCVSRNNNNNIYLTAIGFSPGGSKSSLFTF